MEPDGSAQAYLDLSRSYLEVAKAASSTGNAAPARHNSIHALELAVKACLVGRVKDGLRTHNVGGLFGNHYRRAAGSDVCKRVNRLLDAYDGPRYPEWETLPEEQVDSDLAFIEEFVTTVAPSLLEHAR